jgi:DNA-binding NarL/FixJ family response regulator
MTAYDAVQFAIGAPNRRRASGRARRPAAAQLAPGGTVGPAGPRAGLTPRQLQIARLIARGLTNKQIADELVISPATVARHIANIFADLDFNVRAQVAAWVAERDSAAG